MVEDGSYCWAFTLFDLKNITEYHTLKTKGYISNIHQEIRSCKHRLIFPKFLHYKRSSISLSDLVNYNAKIPQKITGFPFQIILLSAINILFKSLSGLNLYSFSTMQSNNYVYCPRGELVPRNEILVKSFCPLLQI